MKNLTSSQFEELIRRGTVLITSSTGEAMVVQTPDDRIIKMIYDTRRLPIRAPRAVRFKRNCQRLTDRGFQTVTVQDIFRYKETNSFIVIYHMVKGRELADILDEETDDASKKNLLTRVAHYYRELHDKGVYCRPTHLHNIIVCPDTSLALIDVHNVRFQIVPLLFRQRARNFKSIFKYDDHTQHVIHAGAEDFFTAYMSESRMGPFQRRRFIKSMIKHVPKFFKNGTREFIS